MSDSQTERSFRDEDAVRDDPGVVEYPQAQAADVMGAKHESQDVGLQILGAAAIVVGGLVIVALVVVRLLTSLYYQSPETQPQTGSPAQPVTPPVAVDLRVNPLAALETYEATAEAKLSGYGWVDQDAGVARVPITRAMTLMIQGVQPVLQADVVQTPSPAGTSTP